MSAFKFSLRFSNGVCEKTDRSSEVISFCLVLIILPVIFFSCSSRSLDNEGEKVELDGYRLYTKDRGSGVPTVIIENGLCCNTSLYDDLYQRISRYTRVVSYDHSGIGRSTYNGRPRTLENFSKELKALLEYKKISPPYILIGHSMGGFLIRYFAHLYPDEIAGLVFIDAPSEDWFAYIRSRHTPEELGYFNNFFDPAKRKLKEGSLAELSYYTNMCDSIRGKKIPSQIPVRMYTGAAVGSWAKEFGYNHDDMIAWAKMQHSVLDGVLDAQQIVDKRAGHMFHIDNQRVVLKGIKNLIKEYREHSTRRKDG